MTGVLWIECTKSAEIDAASEAMADWVGDCKGLRWDIDRDITMRAYTCIVSIRVSMFGEKRWVWGSVNPMALKDSHLRPEDLIEAWGRGGAVLINNGDGVQGRG